MFKLFKKKPKGESITLKIDGMHCTSCSMNIDGELEDTPGVIEANTNYAQAKSVIIYDPKVVTPDKLKKVIESLDYTVK